MFLLLSIISGGLYFYLLFHSMESGYSDAIVRSEKQEEDEKKHVNDDAHFFSHPLISLYGYYWHYHVVPFISVLLFAYHLSEGKDLGTLQPHQLNSLLVALLMFLFFLLVSVAYHLYKFKDYERVSRALVEEAQEIFSGKAKVTYEPYKPFVTENK